MSDQLSFETTIPQPDSDIVLPGATRALWHDREVASCNWVLVDREALDDDEVTQALQRLGDDTRSLGQMVLTQLSHPQLLLVTEVTATVGEAGLEQAVVEAAVRTVEHGGRGLMPAVLAVPLPAWDSLDELKAATERSVEVWSELGFRPLPDRRPADVGWAEAQRVWWQGEVDTARLAEAL